LNAGTQAQSGSFSQPQDARRVRGRYAGESCPALDLESAKRQSRIALARLAYATFPLLMPAVDVRTDVGAGAEGGSLRRW